MQFTNMRVEVAFGLMYFWTAKAASASPFIGQINRANGFLGSRILASIFSLITDIQTPFNNCQYICRKISKDEANTIYGDLRTKKTKSELFIGSDEEKFLVGFKGDTEKEILTRILSPESLYTLVMGKDKWFYRYLFKRPDSEYFFEYIIVINENNTGTNEKKYTKEFDKNYEIYEKNYSLIIQLIEFYFKVVGYTKVNEPEKIDIYNTDDLLNIFVTYPLYMNKNWESCGYWIKDGEFLRLRSFSIDYPIGFRNNQIPENDYKNLLGISNKYQQIISCDDISKISDFLLPVENSEISPYKSIYESIYEPPFIVIPATTSLGKAGVVHIISKKDSNNSFKEYFEFLSIISGIIGEAQKREDLSSGNLYSNQNILILHEWGDEYDLYKDIKYALGLSEFEKINTNSIRKLSERFSINDYLLFYNIFIKCVPGKSVETQTWLDDYFSRILQVKIKEIFNPTSESFQNNNLKIKRYSIEEGKQTIFLEKISLDDNLFTKNRKLLSEEMEKISESFKNIELYIYPVYFSYKAVLERIRETANNDKIFRPDNINNEIRGTVIELVKNNFEIINHLEKIWRSNFEREWEKTISAFDLISEGHRNDPILLRKVVEAYRNHGDNEKALHYAKQVESIESEEGKQYASTYLLLALQSENEDKNRAIKYYKEALKSTEIDHQLEAIYSLINIKKELIVEKQMNIEEKIDLNELLIKIRELINLAGISERKKSILYELKSNIEFINYEETHDNALLLNSKLDIETAEKFDPSNIQLFMQKNKILKNIAQ